MQVRLVNGGNGEGLGLLPVVGSFIPLPLTIVHVCALRASPVSLVARVWQVRLVNDSNGKPRGYAFVEFHHTRDMKSESPLFFRWL